jgi:hypothetical protein
MNTVRDKLKLWKLEQERTLVKEQFCEEHQCDIENIVSMIDSMITTAVSCGKSPQAYAELQRERSQFIDHLLTVSQKYRVVDV